MFAAIPTPTAIEGPSIRLGVIDSPMMESHVQKVVIVLGNETQELEININNGRSKFHYSAGKAAV
jgi:hypothetical protein